MLVLLLRPRLRPWIEWFLNHPSRTALFKAGLPSTDVVDFRRLLDITVTWEMHWNAPWALCGQPLDESSHFELKPFHIAAVQAHYDWSILSRGADFTAMMAAFISSNEQWTQEAKARLAAFGCSDLLLSDYMPDDIALGRFHGFVFSRRKDQRGDGVWSHVSQDNRSVLAFALDWQLPRELKERNEIVAIESAEKDHGRGMCLRVTRAEQFARVAGRSKLLVSDDLPQDRALRTVDDFDALLRDPIRYAVRELGGPRIVYVPDTPRAYKEILICRTPALCSSLMGSIRKSATYREACFC